MVHTEQYSLLFKVGPESYTAINKSMITMLQGISKYASQLYCTYFPSTHKYSDLIETPMSDYNGLSPDYHRKSLVQDRVLASMTYDDNLVSHLPFWETKI